jgi:hypothetical protein
MLYNRINITIGLSLLVLLPQITLAEGSVAAAANAVPSCSSGLGSVFCINNVFVLTVALAALFAVFMCVIAGFMFVVGDKKDMQRAKEMISTALVALVITAASYVLLQAADGRYTTFKKVVVDAPIEQVLDPGSELVGLEPRCQNCVNVVDMGVPVAEWSNVYVTKPLAFKLKQLYEQNKDWRITEAYPPTVDHINTCHRNGTCVDIGVYPRLLSASRISVLCRDAQRLKINITNEYFDPDLNLQNSFCPRPSSYETTQGGHLHIK